MKSFKKPLTLVLTLSLLLSCSLLLTGCDKEPSSSSSGSGSAAGSETPTGTIFVAEYTPINAELTSSLERAIYHDGRFLTSSYGMIADNTPEGVVPEYEGQYWEYGYSLYWLDMEGNLEKVENYAPMAVPEGVNGSSYVQSMFVTADGGIITLDNLYTYYFDGPEGLTEEDEEYWQYMVYEEKYYLRTLAADGSEQSCVELTSLASSEDEYFYPNGMSIDDEGNIYIITWEKLFVLDAQGQLLFDISSDYYFENIVKLSDGRVTLMLWGDTGYELVPIDLEAKALGEPVPVNGDIYSIITGGGEYDFYYTNGTNFFGYDLESGTSTKLFNWINCDINRNDLGQISVLPDGTVVAIINEWNYNEGSEISTLECELVKVVEKPASSVPQKTTLSLATMYLNYELQEKIIKFNKSNTEYRIELQDYSEYNTEEDYSAGLTKLTTEILSGNVPDLIDLNGLPLERFVAKGLLEDLYPYIDSDSEMSREDFFENVLAALETEGGLYRTATSFGVNTVIGASRVVGDEPGWTLEEFKEAYATMPEGCTVFDEYTTRSDILYSLLYFEMDNLVNWTTGECSFDSSTFTNLLEFAMSFPSEYDWENYVYDESNYTSTRLRSGKQMLLNAGIYDFEYLRMYEALFGTDITCVGFPTETGVGNSFTFNGISIAMSSKSEHKDVCWQFIRQFFGKDLDSRYSYGFPINKDAFNDMLEEAMTPRYETDAEGNYVLDENGNKIEISQGTWGWDDIEVEMYALTQEQADLYMELIESTDRAMDYDSTEIIDMVTQEAEAYFAGQKSAEEVAKLTQSKVNIFVNEQR